MAGSVSNHPMRSLFSLEREVEIDYVQIRPTSRALKQPQPLAPQPDLRFRDTLELSPAPQEQNPLNLLQFPVPRAMRSASV
ncbi:hypothetical protein COW36_22215 [bacterium (Candidatus Blackallbacteria) CG17_big_fil_post_rev_8_21_14_2_50_48_46]|uniref:Uncharacterized protein n=1 Tax=bacterium (Candidatus Blackallbacteria) CG17_big_fil_post_rev_8_21_14_2_50_48_46 TaxID=2014261 RepID=A0A2M7FZ14_9BACT|nr:MAG: hypothetical protein COW64_13645 [bacterium (Candidatus Blackallbacteria) CG18_big_fil_WC_8_21_14_2_50_49_26]PIW14330.1 MAG: hypothetical protein COW36_22215 [bacterium (Candidatus Blackallbacteria) CG17_big_fil_post_rev_8_21_14_2_50_48_46]PIW45599.1 MAG: hypothetical protein COW20_19820 [bacterium (Candidatus Blackallbacteria) CG13_big_fil_rev_8_21_14_2_50_49_14]